MGLIRMAALGALGYAGYKYFKQSTSGENAAFAGGQGDRENFSQVRDAGPAAMADSPRHWSKEDQLSDESFPASDPPSTY
jgi:uncharacterized membrane protein YebE (DUF533 family)